MWSPSAQQGQPDLAIGNVVGSNTANILLILGLSAVIMPLVVQQQVFRRDRMVMLAASLALAGLAVFGAIDRWAGAILLVAAAAFVIRAYISGRREQALADVYAAEANEMSDVPRASWKAPVMALVGLVLLVAGARMLVTGRVDIARDFGVPECGDRPDSRVRICS